MGEIILDYVGLERFERLRYATSCEDCTHFDGKTEACTFGFPTALPPAGVNQVAQLEKDGRMAFCRTHGN